jgi:cell division septation protein DedD
MSGQGWVSTLLGVFVLVVGGFALGLIVGVVSEEPELVVGHVAGRSTDVDWSVAGAAEAGVGASAEPAPVPARVDVAAGPPPAPTSRPAPAPAAKPAARPAPAAAPAPRPVRAAEPGFAVQVGAFGTPAAANGVAQRLRAAGYPVKVLAPESDDRWRVRVAPIASRAEAEQTARRLKVEESLPTWVLREQAS